MSSRARSDGDASAGTRQHEPCHDRSQRHVEEEHPLPARSLDQQAAEDRPSDRGGAAGRAEDAERAVAFRSFGERPGEDGERVRHCERSTETLTRTRRDQDAERAGHAADERRGGEHTDTGHEDLAMTHEVARAPAQHQEARHGHAVDDDHPLEVGRLGMEVGLNRGESDIDDGEVDHGHRCHTAHQRQNRILRQRTRGILSHTGTDRFRPPESSASARKLLHTAGRLYARAIDERFRRVPCISRAVRALGWGE